MADLQIKRRNEAMVKGVSSLAAFLKKLSSVERSKSVQLVKLVESRAQEALTEPPSVRLVWAAFQGEMQERSQRGAVIAKTLEEEAEGLERWMRESEGERKKLLEDASALEREQTSLLTRVASTKKSYWKCCEEAERAVESAVRAREQEKKYAKASSALKSADRAQTEYETALDDYNDSVEKWRDVLVPELMERCARMERRRILVIQQHMQGVCEVLKGEETMLRSAVERIDADGDVDRLSLGDASSTFLPERMEPFDAQLDFVPSRTARLEGKPYTELGIRRKKASYHYEVTNTGIMSPTNKRKMVDLQLKSLEMDLLQECELLEEAESLVTFYGAAPCAAPAREAAKAQLAKVRAIQGMMVPLRSAILALEAEGDATPMLVMPITPPGREPVESPRLTVDLRADTVYTRTTSVRCLFSYRAAVESELSFQKGDVLKVLEEDESGWWYCEGGGKRGFVPANYVEKKSKSKGSFKRRRRSGSVRKGRSISLNRTPRKEEEPPPTPPKLLASVPRHPTTMQVSVWDDEELEEIENYL